MIEFPCPKCSRKLRVKDERAGQKGKCPHCAYLIVVPAASAALADAAMIPPRQAPTEAATVPPKEGAAVSDGRRDTPSEADATSGAKSSPSSELIAFLAPPQAPGEIGRLGPYRILNVLGAGGMGVVFQAEDPSLQRLVALKAMLPMLAVSATARERFLREARSAAAVEHDNIVAIYQVGEDRGVPYLAMPFLKGEPLDVRIQRDKRLPTAEVLRIARETATGLEAAHQRGMIHRDIKPANLWLEEGTGRVKILDFGLARTTGKEGLLTQQGAILGTPSYMAPEQAGGKPDHRSDLFSLACVLYHMATGELPFKGADAIATLMAVAHEPARPPIDVNPGLPSALSELILRLLAKKPDERPASAQAVIEAVRAIEADPKAKVKLPPSPSAEESDATSRAARRAGQVDEPAVGEEEEEIEDAELDDDDDRPRRKRRRPARVTPKDRQTAPVLYVLGIFTSFIGPLILWRMKRDDSEFLDHHGKEVVNFSITLFVPSLVLIAGGCPFIIFTWGLAAFIIVPLFMALSVYWLVMLLMGAMRAYHGEWWRFPLSIRMLK